MGTCGLAAARPQGKARNPWVHFRGLLLTQGGAGPCSLSTGFPVGITQEKRQGPRPALTGGRGVVLQPFPCCLHHPPPPSQEAGIFKIPKEEAEQGVGWGGGAGSHPSRGPGLRVLSKACCGLTLPGVQSSVFTCTPSRRGGWEVSPAHRIKECFRSIVLCSRVALISETLGVPLHPPVSVS